MYIFPQKPLIPTEIVGGCIAIFENAWKDPDKDIETIEKVVSDPNSEVKFTKAQEFSIHDINQGVITPNRTNYNLGLTTFSAQNEEIRLINNKCFEIMYAGTQFYSQKLAHGESFIFAEQLNLLKYNTGEEYKAHFDGGTDSKRALSPIIYLNNTYTGGELEFVNFGIKLKPSPGMLVLFPSNYAYAHIAHPVLTGTKYAIVTWLHDQLPAQPAFGSKVNF